nr:hypothetical protein [uncultured Desulfobacter sp.]
MIDDHMHVPAVWRLIVHFVVVGLVFYLLVNPSQISSGYHDEKIGWGMVIVGVWGAVWFLNLFNFMDGIDGIAGVEAICVLGGASLICFLLNGTSTRLDLFLMLVLISGCLGFLFWNWPPAKIFMGDVGSGFLGYIIVVFSLKTIIEGSIFFWVWTILAGVFLVDSGVTLLVRLLRFEKVYQAHCSHAYQKAAKYYGSHKKVTVAVLLINLFWLWPMAMVVGFFPNLGLPITTISLIPLILIAFIFRAGK